ncbi:MAG: hypothetical protein O3A46_02830 [Candidatus Poribacteria bacterium]|nr:hypothetical protein [Candidatus Poribacteria bacterium]
MKWRPYTNRPDTVGEDITRKVTQAELEAAVREGCVAMADVMMKTQCEFEPLDDELERDDLCDSW